VRVASQLHRGGLQSDKLVLYQVWQVLLQFGAFRNSKLLVRLLLLVHAAVAHPKGAVVADDFGGVGPYRSLLSAEVERLAQVFANNVWSDRVRQHRVTCVPRLVETTGLTRLAQVGVELRD